MTDDAIISSLQAKLKAQQKTIDVLIHAAEKQHATAHSSLELMSQNLNLEQVVRQKTASLQKQGEELRETLQNLQQTQVRLLQAQKLESVGQLAAGIAHEINTPAQFIGSNLDFLEGSFADVKQLLAVLSKLLEALHTGSGIDQISKEAESLLTELDWEYLEKEIPTAIRQSQEGLKRVVSIVQAMKEFSHPGNKEKSFHDINKIIETTITVARNEWKYCSEIVINLAADLPPVFCLADEIGQVLLNILVNAAHAIVDKYANTPNKGQIIISTQRIDQLLQICIEDTGAGIPEDVRPKIFDPFFTTKAVGRGTGQGLAIAHDVIQKKHNGTINFSSELGKGTIFTIHLPFDEATR